MKTLLLSMFLGTAMFAGAHPGPPGHYHPGEVDEFDQTAHSVVTKQHNAFDLGGILALLGVSGCLAFAFLQKDNGFWSDATANH